jgi:cell division protein FtsB
MHSSLLNSQYHRSSQVILVDDNTLLVRRIAELEQEIGKLKAENQNLVKTHLLEMRNRGSKELRVVTVVCACVLVYTCVVLITRGYYIMSLSQC